MKVAIPVWDGQVSPVFDVARRVDVFELEAGAVKTVSTRRLHPGRAAAELAELGVDVLVCSAISLEMETVLRVAGVEVASEVCGPVDQIIGALATGDDALGSFRSPAVRRSRPSHRLRETRRNPGIDRRHSRGSWPAGRKER